MNQFEIITICAHCGKIIHIQNNVFSSKLFKSKNFSLSPNTQLYNQKKNIVCCCQISQSFHFAKQLTLLQNMLTNSGILFFPLCQDCFAISKQQIIFMADFYNIASSDFFTINTTISAGMLKSRLDKLNIFLNSKKRVFPRKPRKSTPAITTKIKKATAENENEEKKKKSMQTNENSLKNPLFTAIERRLSTPSSLLSFYSFSITSNRHYGVINQARVGFFKYNPNTYLENSTAMFFICHLIYQLKCIFKIPEICVSFNPISIWIVRNKNEVIDFSSHKLDFPIKKSQVNEFNGSIEILFNAFILINGASSRFKKYGEPPFNIDLKNKKIDNFCFLLNWKDYEEWSISMKLLLINLKCIQFRAAKSFINQF